MRVQTLYDKSSGEHSYSRVCAQHSWDDWATGVWCYAAWPCQTCARLSSILSVFLYGTCYVNCGCSCVFLVPAWVFRRAWFACWWWFGVSLWCGRRRGGAVVWWCNVAVHNHAMRTCVRKNARTSACSGCVLCVSCGCGGCRLFHRQKKRLRGCCGMNIHTKLGSCS